MTIFLGLQHALHLASTVVPTGRPVQGTPGSEAMILGKRRIHMITQQIVDAACAVTDMQAHSVTQAQVRAALEAGLPWRMSSVDDAARATGLELCLVDNMLYAAMCVATPPAR